MKDMEYSWFNSAKTNTFTVVHDNFSDMTQDEIEAIREQQRSMTETLVAEEVTSDHIYAAGDVRVACHRTHGATIIDDLETEGAITTLMRQY